MATLEDQPTRRRSDDELRGEPLRVLAVDDDRMYLKRLRLVLTRAGFDVVTADDGAAAIERLRQDRDISVLLIDLSMPGMDGIETVRHARDVSAFPGLYAILLTASDGTEVKLRALDSGLDDFLTKSSPDSEILAKLRSAARRIEMERRLHLENEELQTLALTDELTGIANRRALFRAADAILSSGKTLSVALFDLDRFKQINDTYGHLMGDRILADVAACLKQHTRVDDLIARYGGDEFVLLLPDTNMGEARQIVDRIRTRIADLRWEHAGRSICIAVGTGLSTAGSGSSIVTLLAESDAKLYDAKMCRDSGEGAELGLSL
ncbi:MAG TPA: diguanylate cyclase [Thermoanaerobaculia bacterium]|jgi:diguanylate cyclase (GGDEF)-like protein|nr:diguanylate cyclase [Thermoanaerobaculia bacterium]